MGAAPEENVLAVWSATPPAAKRRRRSRESVPKGTEHAEATHRGVHGAALDCSGPANAAPQAGRVPSRNGGRVVAPDKTGPPSGLGTDPCPPAPTATVPRPGVPVPAAPPRRPPSREAFVSLYFRRMVPPWGLACQRSRQSEAPCPGRMEINSAADGRRLWLCSHRWHGCRCRWSPPEPVLSPALRLEAIDRDSFRISVTLASALWTKVACGGLRRVLQDLGLAAHVLSEATPAQAGPGSVLGPAETGGAQGESAGAVADVESSGAAASGPPETCPVVPESVVVPMGSYPEVVDRLRRAKVLDRVAAEIPAGVLMSLQGRTPREGEGEVASRLARVPQALRARLLPFQVDAVRFGLKRGGRVLLADEMGVGKSVQALAIATCYRDQWPLLVVAPAALRLVWVEQIEVWLPGVRPADVSVVESSGDAPWLIPSSRARPPVTVASYDMLARLSCHACRAALQGQGPRGPEASRCRASGRCMAGGGWGVVIADESHCLRACQHGDGPDKTVAALNVIRRAHRAVLLSGTPSLSKPFDLFSQVDALVPRLLGAKDAFGRRYCLREAPPTAGPSGRQPWPPGPRFTSGRHLHELHALLRREVMIRRLKAEVLSQLPPMARHVVRLPPPSPTDWPGSRGVPLIGDAADADSLADADPVARGGVEEGAPMGQQQRVGIAKVREAARWLWARLGVRTEGDEGSPGEVEDGDGAGDGEEGTQGSFGCANSALGCVPRTVIFAHHRLVMDAWDAEIRRAAREMAPRAGVEPKMIRIDGSTDSRERFESCQLFNTRDEYRFALISLTAGGVGIDLSQAAEVVFAELPVEAGWVQQAEGRAHRRGGQANGVAVHFLVAEQTVDEATWVHLMRSMCCLCQVHDGGEGAVVQGGEPSLGEGARKPPSTVEGDAGVSDQTPPAEVGLAWAGDEDAGCSSPTKGRLVEGLKTETTEVVGREAWGGCGEGAGTRGEGALGSEEGSPVASTVVEGDGTPGRDDGACEGGDRDRHSGDVDRECGGGAREGGNGGAPTGTAIDVSDVSASESESESGQCTPETAMIRDFLRKRCAYKKRRQSGGRRQGDEGAAGVRLPGEAGSCDGPGAGECGSVFFEVSPHTRRIHLHRSRDGACPLGLSVPLCGAGMLRREGPVEVFEALQGGGTGAWDLGAHYGIEAAAAVGAMSEAEARAAAEATGRFVREWCEMSAMARHKLLGRVLSADVQSEGAGEGGAPAGEGAGGSRQRVGQAAAVTGQGMPAEAQRRVVAVAGTRGAVREWTVGVLPGPDGPHRLCIMCWAPCGSADARAGPIPFAALFCAAPCHARYVAACTSGGLRRQLARVERGVCQACGLDTRALCLELQSVRRGSPDFARLREAILRRRAPRFFERGMKAYRDRLLHCAQEGFAWNADHIVPVFRGGGECAVDNMRTLCVPCHADVTRRQAGERAREARAARPRGQPTLREFLSQAEEPEGPATLA